MRATRDAALPAAGKLKAEQHGSPATLRRRNWRLRASARASVEDGWQLPARDGKPRGAKPAAAGAERNPFEEMAADEDAACAKPPRQGGEGDGVQSAVTTRYKRWPKKSPITRLHEFLQSTKEGSGGHGVVPGELRGLVEKVYHEAQAHCKAHLQPSDRLKKGDCCEGLAAGATGGSVGEGARPRSAYL